MKPLLLPRPQLEQLRGWLGDRLGLRLDDDRLSDLAGAVQERMRALGCGDVEAYQARLASPSVAAEELRGLVSQVTVGETYFFRQAEHFHVLVHAVLPVLLEGRPPGEPLRILSAGCASGEEAYTIAILLQETPLDADVSVHAVDANPLALQRARQGRYSSWSLRETPADVQDRWFRRDGRDFALDPRLRARVAFEERNLLEPDAAFWRPGAFDVIFCRNVIMYFTPQAVASVIRRMASALRQGGYLFLGAAETLRGVSQDFHLRQADSCFYYERTHRPVLPPAPWAVPPPPVEPPALEWDESWVDAIKHSTERVVELTTTSLQPTVPEPAAGARPEVQQMRALVEQERFAEALDHLRCMSADAREDADVQLLHAAVLTNRGELTEAEGLLRSLLERDELNAGAHYLLALCREHSGDRPDAEKQHRTAAYLDANFAMPHLNLGLLARRRGDADAAHRELQLALSLLAREDSARILLFGGGFSREALVRLCQAALAAGEGPP